LNTQNIALATQKRSESKNIKIYQLISKALIKYVHQELMGVDVSIESWLRGAFRDWSESLLSESSLKRKGHFNPSPIRQEWDELMLVKHNRRDYLGDLLIIHPVRRE